MLAYVASTHSYVHWGLRLRPPAYPDLFVGFEVGWYWLCIASLTGRTYLDCLAIWIDSFDLKLLQRPKFLGFSLLKRLRTLITSSIARCTRSKLLFLARLDWPSKMYPSPKWSSQFVRSLSPMLHSSASHASKPPLAPRQLSREPRQGCDLQRRVLYQLAPGWSAPATKSPESSHRSPLRSPSQTKRASPWPTWWYRWWSLTPATTSASVCALAPSTRSRPATNPSAKVKTFTPATGAYPTPPSV